MTLLPELLQPQRKTAIVDVGAAALDGPRPYEALLERGLCTLVGFEPQAQLWPKPCGASESYRADLVGDGQPGMLRVYAAPGLTSLYEPDTRTLGLYPGLRKWFALEREEKIRTRSLDELMGADPLDFLKIDAQGSEAGIIKGAWHKLAGTVAVQLEVQFVPLYRDQPMFRDLDKLMARAGFLLHSFPQVSRRMILPYVWPADPEHAAMNQVFSADAVYIRDFGALGLLAAESVKQMALIAHYCFRSFDLAFRCLDHLSGRGALPAGAAERYMQSLLPLPTTGKLNA